MSRRRVSGGVAPLPPLMYSPARERSAQVSLRRRHPSRNLNIVPPAKPALLGPSVATLRQALRGRRRDLRALGHAIGTIQDPVLITDRHGRYVAVNEAACRLTGYTAPELLVKALPDLTGTLDAEVADVLWRAFLDQGYQTGEYTLACKDGSTAQVRYEAIANIIPGYHASILHPSDPPDA